MKRELGDGKGFLQENKARGRIAQAPGACKQVAADNHPKRMTGRKTRESRDNPAFRLSRIRFSAVLHGGENAYGQLRVSELAAVFPRARWRPSAYSNLASVRKKQLVAPVWHAGPAGCTSARSVSASQS